MSQLLEGPPAATYTPGTIRATNAAGNAPLVFHNGLPYEALELLGLQIDSISAIDHHHQGLPFTAAGRLAVDTNGVVSYFGHGSAPFTAAGRLCVSTTATGAKASCGVRYNSSENVIYVAS
jgi:hypothetical protein